MSTTPSTILMLVMVGTVPVDPECYGKSGDDKQGGHRSPFALFTCNFDAKNYVS